MPEICRFYGIIIKMYFADHAPPHFHAEYAEHEARIGIDGLTAISGELPARALGLVAEGNTASTGALRIVGRGEAVGTTSPPRSVAVGRDNSAPPAKPFLSSQARLSRAPEALQQAPAKR